MMRDSQSHSSSYMPSKPMTTHPLYSQATLEQHHALLNQYRYSMASAVSPDGKSVVHPHPYVAGAAPVQKTAAVNIIQHEGHTPAKVQDPTKHQQQQQLSPSTPKGESKSEPSSSSTTPVANAAAAAASLSPQMAYLPKHWIWNTSLFYAANRSVAAGTDPAAAFPHSYFAYGNPFATSGGFAMQRDSYRNDGTTSSNTSSSPVQITDVNSDDSSDNHDDLRVGLALVS